MPQILLLLIILLIWSVLVSLGAETDYSKLGGVKQQKCTLSQCWSPEVSNQYQWAGIRVLAHVLQSLLLVSLYCFFQILMAACGYITSVIKARIFKSLFSVSSYGFLLGVAHISLCLCIRIYMIAFWTHSDNPG